jgi:hypothetical protein
VLRIRDPTRRSRRRPKDRKAFDKGKGEKIEVHAYDVDRVGAEEVVTDLSHSAPEDLDNGEDK